MELRQRLESPDLMLESQKRSLKALVTFAEIENNYWCGKVLAILRGEDR